MQKGSGLTVMQKKYIFRLVWRSVALLAAVMLCFGAPERFDVMAAGGFFARFSVLHLFWLVWMGDMIMQLLPLRSVLALGSQKQFAKWFVPGTQANREELREFIRKSNWAAVKVFLVWTAVIWGIGWLVKCEVLSAPGIFLISVFFYVCDLICVLVWCPFRVYLMKNRCCTSCRIFNWDHLMMFAPYIFIPGFYAKSLLFMSILVFAVWELCFIMHPERFWIKTNAALKCSCCTDRLCSGRLTVPSTGKAVKSNRI